MESAGMTVAMVIAQFLDAGKNTVVKKATNNGMKEFVFIVYSDVLSLSFLLPCTLLFYYYYRNTAPPPISTFIICRILLFAFLGCVGQICMYVGLGLSSPTLVSAIMDLLPVFTFILAIASRMENLDLRLRSSQAKCVGTVVSIIGALVVTLYKGLPITILPQPHDHQQSGVLLSQQANWLLGGILLAISSFCFSLVIVVQTWILKDYPEELMVSTIFFTFTVILSAIVAFFAEGNPKAWILRPNVDLVAIFYAAIFKAFILNVMYGWACRKKGPVYVAIFSPLGMVIALCMGVAFLGDTLYLGRMIGCAIIAIGFYGVIWGLAQEEKMMVNQKNNEISSYVSSSAPLLHNKSIDA